MRVSLIFVLCASLSFAQAPAPKASRPSAPALAPQSAVEPDEGSLDGNTYTSDFFRFSYNFPSGFEVDDDFLQGREDESRSTFVLLAAYGPFNESNQRPVVVLMADKNATTLEGYLAKLTREVAQKQGFEVLRTPYPVMIGGRKFLRADFRKQQVLQSALFTLEGQYLLGFNLAAPSASEMEKLNLSLNSVTFTATAPRPRMPQARPASPARSKREP